MFHDHDERVAVLTPDGERAEINLGVFFSGEYTSSYTLNEKIQNETLEEDNEP